ncbi:MAG: sigma-70 family RNA polymerase sigma factor [Kiritimatiellae bacterium]|nr:sigma-70 family RNA polymerase sigma factor [Kiritimatiellia bacterium]
MGPDADELVRRVLDGDVDAFAAIIRLHQREVWRVVTAMLYDRRRTEDLVQQTFVNAYEHLFQYIPGRDFALWLKQIARNAVRQELRRHAREQNKLQNYWESLRVHWRDEHAAERRQAAVSEALEACRGRLPPNARRLLELRYERAMGFEEIAEALGRTVAATRQFLSRIRLGLRECMQKEMVRT